MKNWHTHTHKHTYSVIKCRTLIAFFFTLRATREFLYFGRKEAESGNGDGGFLLFCEFQFRKPEIEKCCNLSDGRTTTQSGTNIVSRFGGPQLRSRRWQRQSSSDSDSDCG